MFDFIEWHCETVLKHVPFCLLSDLKLEIKILISMRISIIIGNIPHSLPHLLSYMCRTELKLITQILWEIGWDWCKSIKGMEFCGNIIQDLTTMFGNSKQFRLNIVWWSGIWTQIYQVVLFLAPIRDLLSSRGFLKIVECPSKFFLSKCVYHKRKLDISAGSFTENADLW